MGFIEAIKTCLKKYACFQGRARRSEYWWWTLAASIIGYGIYLPVILAEPNWLMKMYSDSIPGWIPALLVLYVIYCLAIFLPSLGVLVRRLHDIGKSGWYYFVIFIPIAGPFILLAFLVQDSNVGDNQYGPNPKLNADSNK